jgi:pimeloyl-ACP methyl ester carboxylesterase
VTLRTHIAAAALACLLLTAADASAATTHVATRAVSFNVKNTNTSGVPCSSDGASYTVRGHLVGPRRLLAGGPKTAVTLYYHGLSYGEFFWRFKAVRGYDFSAKLARAGQVSLVVDRLGYGASGKPPGAMSCYGSQADVAHQMVGALRHGGYTASGGRAPKFGKVILAGHSGSGYTVEDEAYSYKDIDGLIEAAFSDGGASPLAVTNAGKTQMICATGGQQVYGNSGPSGYAYYGQTDEDFRSASFSDADPAVVAAATRMRTRDPCGETQSAVSTGASNSARAGEVTVPVLIVEGADDKYFPPPAADLQRTQFSGSSDVTALTLPGTAHAVTLGRSAPLFAKTVASWLNKRYPAPAPVKKQRAKHKHRKKHRHRHAGARFTG